MVTVPEFNLECSYKIDVVQVRIGEFAKSPVYTVVKLILRAVEGAQVVSQFLDEPSPGGSDEKLVAMSA